MSYNFFPVVPTFTASIETTEGSSFQHGYHLGTDERTARKCIEDIFNDRVKHGQPVVTVALMQRGKMLDVFGGTWHNADMDAYFEEMRETV